MNRNPVDVGVAAVLRVRTGRAGHASRSPWLVAMCWLSLLVVGVGAVGAADPASPGEPGIESGDFKNRPRSLVLKRPPIQVAQPAPSPDSVTVTGCPVVVVPTDGGSSINQRAPNSNAKFGRAVYLITATELANSGLANGTVPSAIGWHYSTAPGVAANGTLKVYLQNTPDTTNLKSTTWATAIAGMTIVHNASTTLPNSAVPFDIPFAGGSPFTYTGGGLYVAFDWSWAGPVTSTAIVQCNTTLTDGLKGAQSNTSAPNTTTASDFRPETRLTPPVPALFNDASVEFAISLGSLAQPLVGNQYVQAVVVNRGAQNLNNVPVTFNLTGAETFTSTQIIPLLTTACDDKVIVTFAPFNPSAIGTDTVTVSVPSDDNDANNSKNRRLDETFNLYSYKHPATTASGGVGVTDATGTFVSKFTTAVAAKISAVNLEFFAASATNYKVAIYPNSGGLPGVVPLYVDAANRTVAAAGPVTITLPSPVAVGAGTFYAGIQQTNTINAALSFDNESPIRSGAFFLAPQVPPDAWFDFSPDNNFKLNIGVTLVQCATALDCNDGNACTLDSCQNQLCVYTNTIATSCDGNPCSNPDSCSNGTCIPGPNPCNDSNACTNDLCDGLGGGCSHTAVDCNDNNPCTNDSCIPGSGCAHSNNTSSCSDGNACTVGDACSNGACVPGTVPLPAPVQFCNGGSININDSVAPSVASPYPSSITVANQGSYLCKVTVNLNGITHLIPDDIDVLLEHLAGPSAIIMSDAGPSAEAMNVSLTLSDSAAGPIPGTLVAGTFKPTNLVGAGGGTESWPAPAPAPPAPPGSALSTFIGRNPNGLWKLYVVDDFAGSSGSMSGWCVNVVSVCTVNGDCNDGNACTTDTCVSSQCVFTNTVTCNDGNACTANNCNPANGLCEFPAIVCNDSNPCTSDSCNTSTGCVFTGISGPACNDNSLCTSPDICQSGVCVGQNPINCTPDSNVCTTESCNPATGGCISTNNTNSCDDGIACTAPDVCGPKLGESFDGVTAPALPAGWTTSVTGIGNPWSTVSTSSDTAPNSAFGYDGMAIADELLVTPTVNIVSAATTLTFRTRWSFEGTTTPFDGSVLEISMNGGAFTDIVSAGGSFVSGGYNGVISPDFLNPLAGRSAWTLTSAGYPAYLTTVVNLPASAAGKAIKLQWHIGTDDSNGAPGQNIDSIALRDGGTNSCAGPTITAPPEVQSMTAINKTTFIWSGAQYATRYDTVRGRTNAFPVGPGGGDETCFDNLPTSTVVDSIPPTAGIGYWYLSRGENSCGNGTWGTGAGGATRTTTTCP